MLHVAGVSVPGPGDVLGAARSVAGWSADALGAAATLPQRAVELIGEIEQLIRRVTGVIEDAEAMIERIGAVAAKADAAVTAAGAVAASADALVTRAAPVTAEAETTMVAAAKVGADAAKVIDKADAAATDAAEILATYRPLAERLAPMARRFAEELSEDEVHAAIRLIDHLPDLAQRFERDILPVLTTLENVGPDVRELVKVLDEVRQAVHGIPGFQFFRRRGEDTEEAEEAGDAEHAVETGRG